MRTRKIDTVKLGIFVLTGLVLLILTLYMLGKNRNLFGARFELKTRFEDVNGLVPGNNVRYSGIDIGSVSGVAILNDTVIEVTMSIDKKMKDIIRSNAVAGLGSDGLIGNRVVNISPGAGEAPLVSGGEVLRSREEISTQGMLQTLNRTNENIAVITEELRQTVHRINTSAQLAELLEDRSIAANLKASLVHLHETTEKASDLMSAANETLSLASQGEGTLATLLTDTSLAAELKQAVRKIKTVESGAERLADDLDAIARSVDKDLNSGSGPVNALMKDSVMAERLRRTLEHVEEGTAAFNLNMEAMRHNFLFRGYFKKLEKQQKKAEKEAIQRQ